MHFTHLLGNYAPPGQSLLNRCDLDNISSLIIVSNDSLKTSYYWFFFSVPTSIFQTLADSFEYSLHNKLLLTILSIPFALVYLGEAHRSISRYGMNKLWLGMTMCWQTENIDADCSTRSNETCGSRYAMGKENCISEVTTTIVVTWQASKVVRQSRNYTLQPWQQKTWIVELIILQVRWRRRRNWTWPTWARTWTATSRAQPPPPPSTPSPPSCPPSSSQPWTPSNHLEEGAVGNKRMKNHFLEYRLMMEVVAVVDLKVGSLERQMSGCLAWQRSKESLDSWPVWSWAWSALDWQSPSSPCSWSTPESSPSCSPWAAPSPCPASHFCGVPTITWSTCWAGRGFPSPPSTSLHSSSPSTLQWVSSLPSSHQSQHVPRWWLLFGL